MGNIKKRIIAALMLLAAVMFTGCGGNSKDTSVISNTTADTSSVSAVTTSEAAQVTEDTKASETTSQTGEGSGAPVYGEYYYDVENVVLYLEEYGELPPNYITKKEAEALGWSGGSVEDFKEGAAIGGDRFGNYEELLPKSDGRTYTECDIDTDGYPSRGSRRLVFSNDGLYFYTSDHYESFSQVTVTKDGDVIW